MKNKISINIDHPNVKRMEAFLSFIEEPLTEVIPFEWKHLKLSDAITGACQFISATPHPATISIFFCDSYSDCNNIAKANAFPYTPTAKWSLNGNLLYLVECEDKEQVSHILGIFAGEE